LLITITRN